MNVSIDDRFVGQHGTEKQHRYISFLASKAGYTRLRDVAADYFGCSVSRAGKKIITVKDASSMIDWLKTRY